jgi:hypothetical protein
VGPRHWGSEACRGTPDPDVFFPPVTTGPAAARQVAAANYFAPKK